MFLFYSTIIFSMLVVTTTALDTITTTQPLRDRDTLISSDGTFELGFFNPSGSTINRFVGVWYKNISDVKVVWVANREIPLTDTSGSLRVVQPGILAIFNGRNDTIWSSNTSRSSSNPVAKLLNSGNFVVRDAIDDDDANLENSLWQSFDYPSDTLLPGMKLGKDFVTGRDRYLRSWKSDDDPSPGDFTFLCDPQGYPQLVTRNGSVLRYRSGPWNGLRFSGTPNLRENPIYRFMFVYNEKEVYYRYNLEGSTISRLGLTSDGGTLRWVWVNRTQTWTTYVTVQTDNCDLYGLCGAHGSCNVENSPPCRCLDKFEPKSLNQWEKADWSNGCVRRRALNCQSDGFVKYSGIKLPDTKYSWFNRTMSLGECEMVCKKNCTCTAYSNLDIRNEGSGCLLWFGYLLDIREYPINGQDIFIRLASSELDVTYYKSGSEKKTGNVVKIMLPIIVAVALIGLFLMLYARRRKSRRKTEGKQIDMLQKEHTNESQKEDFELPMFDLPSIAKATSEFSIDNKLGEGGFGPVYKGVLEEGQDIAVKRLSKTSRQGLEEFKNEVTCIAKLQHRNLVKLLGCCIEGEEKMLIYEYMPNKSLDSFIFDGTRRQLLDWPTCFNMINGIARGLLYLHEDSCLRIIHRDLKAGNILLDINMIPKISDFGLARIFYENETGANTQRVVGTHGYMAPEYVIEGIFSVKSDVFSFGVLVLEIISGKKNKGFIHQDHNHNLLGHAWRLYNVERSMELIDASLMDTYCSNEALRSIHVGLLCVQQSPHDRPSMSSVVLMLGSEGALPPPKQPGFFIGRNIRKAECSSSATNAPSSNDEITITLLEGR